MKFLTIASSTLLVLLLQDAPATVDARLRVSAVNKKTAQDDALLPRVHVVRKLQGVKLDGMGGIPPQDAYPLQLCEGDCDVDSDVSLLWPHKNWIDKKEATPDIP